MRWQHELANCLVSRIYLARMLDASSRKEGSHRGAPPLTCEKYKCTSNRSKAKLNSGRPTTISQDLESSKELMMSISFHAKTTTVRTNGNSDDKDGLPCVTNDFKRYFTLRKKVSCYSISFIVAFYRYINVLFISHIWIHLPRGNLIAISLLPLVVVRLRFHS